MKEVDTKYVLNERHVRKTLSLIESKAYHNLTANAIRLYEVLSYKFYENRWTETDFAVARDFGVKVLGLSKNSGNCTRRALKKLVDWGFLERTYISEGNGEDDKPNRYKFSNKWIEYGKIARIK